MNASIKTITAKSVNAARGNEVSVSLTSDDVATVRTTGEKDRPYFIRFANPAANSYASSWDFVMYTLNTMRDRFING